MIAQSPDPNSDFIAAETEWLSRLIAGRIALHRDGDDTTDILTLHAPPNLQDYSGAYAGLLAERALSATDRLVLVLALASVVAPQELDPFLIINQSINQRFTEFGGKVCGETGLFLPTVQTALFILAGNNIALRLRILERFVRESSLEQTDLLAADTDTRNRAMLSRELCPTEEARALLLWEREYDPPFSMEFPAERLRTGFDWADLILPEDIRSEIEEIVLWIRNERKLLDEWHLSRRVAPGYRCLFDGPPGTGKTLTASLLGKATGRAVYRVDLSKLVSKYIGETEKNLGNLFDRARHRDWILFFDEADALFGKRGDGNTASDRAGNQNVAYLLQRIESFDGVVILASNLPGNIDAAFSRRFQSIIHFRKPDSEERYRLWVDNFEDKPFAIHSAIDWHEIARTHKVTGGEIVNILRYCCMRAIERQSDEILLNDIIAGIRQELEKSGRYL